MTDRETNYRRKPRRPAAEEDHKDIRDAGSYYRDREEYFRERDRYYAERDKYYRDRDRYYEEMDEYSRTAESAAEDAIIDDYEDDHYDDGGSYDRGESYKKPVRKDVRKAAGPSAERPQRQKKPAGAEKTGRKNEDIRNTRKGKEDMGKTADRKGGQNVKKKEKAPDTHWHISGIHFPYWICGLQDVHGAERILYRGRVRSGFEGWKCRKGSSL